jgi:hypothetical protein
VEAYHISTLGADAHTLCVLLAAAESNETEADMSTDTNIVDAAPQIETYEQKRRAGMSLRVRLRRGRIDRDLAEARVDNNSEEHRLREAQLASEANRRDIARSLREVVTLAENPRAEWLGSTALLNRDVVVPSRDGLMGLVERLEQSGPVDPCGVARARVLASDAMGPLYNPASGRSMGEEISWVADGLDMHTSNGASCASRVTSA